MSNRQKEVIVTFKVYFASTLIRYCTRHIYANFQKMLKDIKRALLNGNLSYKKVWFWYYNENNEMATREWTEHMGSSVV